MLIDWFTVGAQALNFIILVWLLKRFLYKPILNAVDAREKRIAAELADANAKKAEAQKERDEFHRRTRLSMKGAPHFSTRRRTRRKANVSVFSTVHEKQLIYRVPSERKRCEVTLITSIKPSVAALKRKCLPSREKR